MYANPEAVLIDEAPFTPSPGHCVISQSPHPREKTVEFFLVFILLPVTDYIISGLEPTLLQHIPQENKALNTCLGSFRLCREEPGKLM